jgi:hypothetical protein
MPLIFHAMPSSIPCEEPRMTRVSISEMLTKKIVSMKAKEIEKLTGKKMSLKDKLLFSVYKKKMRAHVGDEAKRKNFGKVAMYCGITAWVLLFIPGISILTPLLAVAAIVFGVISLKGNTNVPGIIGIILGSTFLILLIAAIAVLAGSF